MSFITFSHEQLSNPDFSTKREVIRTNRVGGYLGSTLCGCNTRKYHGLLVVPVGAFGGEKHVLLSQLDETIVQHQTEFHLGSRCYRDSMYEPQGYKYLHHFEFLKAPKYTYCAGSAKLTKERLLVSNEQQTLIRYTLRDSNSEIVMQLRPFVAFRNIHGLSKANGYAYTGYMEVPGGIRLRLYENYPWLYMQLSRQSVFKPAPAWYFDIEYEKEKERGYECHEDLFSPGYFEVRLSVGESVVFSAAINEVYSKSLKDRFNKELRKRSDKHTFYDSLRNAATQFTWHQVHHEEDIIAGFPWYDSISRQTFIALPGLRLTQTDRQLGMEILDSYLPFLNGGLFPACISDRELTYNCADTSLWFIWSIQQLGKQGCRLKELGIRYGKAIKTILNAYREGNHVVSMLENGMLFSAEEGKTYTWMDSYSNGSPAVPRYGMPVELNALWYNAICFALELAHKAGDSEFELQWKRVPGKIEKVFLNSFWDEEKGYLADVYNGFNTDWSVRPNMVIAAAMDYTPLSREQQHSILEIADRHLLTPRGLRTLSPLDPAYRGRVNGSPGEREYAFHNGAVHPWLLQFYAEAWLRLNKKSGVAHIRSLIEGFEAEMSINCLGTISEAYDGDHPHAARGAVSQAWNVASILICMHLLSQTEKSKSTEIAVNR
jgi:predicted glycogen debranching enzyme